MKTNLQSLAICFICSVWGLESAAAGCDHRSHELRPGICQWNDQSIAEIEEASEIAKANANGDPILENIYKNYTFSLWSAVTGEPTKLAYEGLERTTAVVLFCASRHIGVEDIDEAVQRPLKKMLAAILKSEERLMGYVALLAERVSTVEIELKDEYCEVYHDATPNQSLERTL